MWTPSGTTIAGRAIAAWLLLSTLHVVPAAADHPERRWTVDDLFASPTPYALGHRGYGANAGEDPNRPIENTLDAFHRAFEDGIRVVELDLQQTADGKIVVFHNDYLEDFTCVASLTYEELLARKPEVPLFRSVLRSARHFSRKGHGERLSGIVFAEIKTPVPLCDGANTSEQAEVSESAVVAAVVAEIRAARMENQVILNSGSPSILSRAALQAPEIQRALTLNVLQMLPPSVVGAITGLPVVPIPKNDCGLSWFNLGVIARLPTFYPTLASDPTPFQRFVGTAIGCNGSKAVSIDKQVFLQAGAVAPALVAALHGDGLEVVAWTIETQPEWDFVAGAGVDGITTNNIALGLASQAPIPGRVHDDEDEGERDRNGHHDALPALATSAATPRLALSLARSNPSRDGTLRIEFVLPDAGPARLGVMDIAGREIESRDVGSFGPGRHEWSPTRILAPGVYLVRLSHDQDQVRAKATVVR